jgi:hypothetical protein
VWLYAIIFAVGIGVGSYSGYKLKEIADIPVIAKANKDADDAKDALKDAEAAFAKSIAESEKNRSDANSKAFNEQEILNAQVTALRGQLAKETSERQNQTTQRLEALKNVTQVDTSPLGPAARSFYSSLRDQQTSNGTNNPAPASH